MGSCLNSFLFFWRHSSGDAASRVADWWGTDTRLTTGWTGERALICCVHQLLQCNCSRPRQAQAWHPWRQSLEKHAHRLGWPGCPPDPETVGWRPAMELDALCRQEEGIVQTNQFLLKEKWFIHLLSPLHPPTHPSDISLMLCSNEVRGRRLQAWHSSRAQGAGLTMWGLKSEEEQPLRLAPGAQGNSCLVHQGVQGSLHLQITLSSWVLAGK